MNAPDLPIETKLREIFLHAVDLEDPAAREAFLDQACAGDSPLRERVRALLQNHRDDSFLEEPASLGPALGARFAGEAATLPSGLRPARVAEDPSPRHDPPAGLRVRYFGDYELLEEIARGGMGVVYRARQVSLNRVVAVKMILSGQLATEADVKRFHTEAEAAANLQHPNIVAIHEIGQHEGRHYFSMDLVEGCSLADMLKKGPLTAVQASELLRTIAEAVHHAHQRATLHRDLKPQNVLIDTSGRPRITDFGLAKRGQEDSALTRTGTAMGSPNYMPPEQATGRLHDVGPTSDVYALGAMLYEMLTGAPPFPRGTAVETLRAMLEEDPVPPGKVRPGLPPDLETICLKCLEKRPSERYPSAQELAEELGRFLDHQPILARPANAGRKALAWCRRHPWILTAAATVSVLGLAGFAYGLWEQTRFLVWRHANPAVRLPGGKVQSLTGAMMATFLFVPLAIAVYWRMHTRSGSTWLGRKLKLPEALLVGPLFAGIGLWSMLRLIRDLVWTRWETADLVAAASMTFVICWTGLILIWKHIRTHGAHWMSLGPTDAIASGFTLKFDVIKLWLGVAVSAPLSTWIGSILVKWGQFRPLDAFLANGRYVMAPAQELAYEEGLRGLFSLFTTFVIIIAVMAGTAWRSPKGSMWRETSPLWIGFWLSGCGMGLAILPTALSASGALLGVIIGVLLLRLAEVRRVASTPEAADRWKRAFRVNEPALVRALLMTSPALILLGFLVVNGTAGERILRAVQLIIVSLVGALASAFRNAGFNRRRVVALLLVFVLPVSQSETLQQATFQGWLDRIPLLLAAATAAYVHYRAGLLPTVKPGAETDPGTKQ